MLSIGKNKHNTNGTTIHAESDAINNLPNKKKKTKILDEVDIIVTRITRHGDFKNSAPCIHCLKSMYENPIKKGYKIKKVYYSNEHGEIECHKLIDLINSEKLYMSSYYRNNKYDINKWYKWRNSIKN